MGSSANTKDRVEGLDVLRLFAALAVVLFHYAFRGAAADDLTNVSLPALVPIAKYGYLGVDLFFVISGFVIAWSADGRNWLQFAVARFARIYPAFVVCMTATFVLTLLFGPPRFETSIQQWAANLLVFSPILGESFMDGAYWSIVYEVIFYGWIALFVLLGFFPRYTWLMVFIWLSLSMLNEHVTQIGLIQTAFVTDHSGFFAAGILLYLFRRGERNLITYLLFALSVLVALDQVLIGAEWLREHYRVATSNIILVLCTLGAIELVAAAVAIKRVPLPAGMIAGIGGLTYPLYLLHQHAGFIIFNRLEGSLAAPAIVSLTVIGMASAAWAIWRFVEPPCRRAVYKLADRPLAAVARLQAT